MLRRRGRRFLATLGALTALLLTAAPLPASPPGAPPVSPAFREAWYQEVIGGKIAAAGEQYLRIYLAPSFPGDLRLRAAFRAGGCFERTGDRKRAREAYSFVVQSAEAGDPLLLRARVRLLDLPLDAAREPAPRAAESGAGLVEKLEARLVRREILLQELRSAARQLDAESDRQARMRRELSLEGVEIVIPGRGEPPAGPGALGLQTAFDPFEEKLFLRELADRYLRRGLRALVARDSSRAEEELEKGIAIQDHPGCHELLRMVRSGLEPPEGLAARAAARLEENEADRREEAERSLRAAVERATVDRAAADRAPGRGAEDLSALRVEIERAAALGECLPPGILSDPVIRQLLEEVQLQLLYLRLTPAPAAPGAGRSPGPIPPAASPTPGSVQACEDLRRRGRQRALELLDAAETTLDLRAGLRGRGKVRLLPDGIAGEDGIAGNENSAGNDRAGQELARSFGLRTITVKMERLLLRGEEEYRRAAEGGGGDAWRLPFQDLLTLTGWFPGLDADQRFSRPAQEHLGRKLPLSPGIPGDAPAAKPEAR